jgi:hypothetical protein
LFQREHGVAQGRSRNAGGVGGSAEISMLGDGGEGGEFLPIGEILSRAHPALSHFYHRCPSPIL